MNNEPIHPGDVVRSLRSVVQIRKTLELDASTFKRRVFGQKADHRKKLVQGQLALVLAVLPVQFVSSDPWAKIASEHVRHIFIITNTRMGWLRPHRLDELEVMQRNQDSC